MPAIIWATEIEKSSIILLARPSSTLAAVHKGSSTVICLSKNPRVLQDFWCSQYPPRMQDTIGRVLAKKLEL